MAARDAAVSASLRHPTARTGAGLLVAATLLASWLGVAASPVAVRGANPYAMATVATYTVDPDAGVVDVSVAVTFTNTTPDPAGRYSVFRSVPIPVQDGAQMVAAHDGSGALTAELGGSGSAGGTVATVSLRTPLRYRKVATFTFAYRLADGANPRIRVRGSAIVVPIWSYGTSGSVTVHLPLGFTVATRGATLTAAPAPDATVLSSGPIEDPATWLALLTATRPAAYETVTRSVPLEGGTMDLRVRAWEDDPTWGSEVLNLLADGLPALQAQIGLPYHGVGPMVVTESLPVGGGQLEESAPGAQEIAVSFDASPFTVLHQAAHVWLGSALISDRWIREGIASEAAARAAAQLDYSLPYVPAAEAKSRTASAMPLDAWGKGTGDPASAATDAWAYASAWDLVDRIVIAVGQETLQEVLARVNAGIGAYAPTGTETASTAVGSPLPLDTHRFLDQLEQLSGRDLDALFAAEVFAPAERPDLDLRTAARVDYASLGTTVGDWGIPDTIRGLMEGWHFDEARGAIADAIAWWRQRDGFIAQVRDAGLAAPVRLRDLWRSHGGDATASAELASEAALVGAYRSAAEQIGGAPNPIERLGLLGQPTPTELLATAAGLFADGDLSGAADGISHALSADRDAQAAGVVRLAIILATLAVLAAADTLVRRRRRPRAGQPPGAGTLPPR